MTGVLLAIAGMGVAACPHPASWKARMDGVVREVYCGVRPAIELRLCVATRRLDIQVVRRL